MRRLGASLLGAAALVALMAGSAAAHAVLVSTSPVDGEVWLVAPSEVVLVFDEPVTAPVGAIRVFDSVGTRVDPGRVDVGSDGRTMVAPLVEDLADGTYIVTWRAVSEDGHPIRGAFVFSVGDKGDPVEDSFVASLLGSSGDRPFTFAAAVSRWIAYSASLLAIGAFAFVLLVEPHGAYRKDVLALVRMACVIGGFASVVQIPLFAAETTGLGLSAMTSATAWGDALSGTVGVAAIVRSFGFVLMYTATVSSIWLGWPAVLALVAADLITGHTRTTEPAWVVWLADAVHIAAAAVWFGGLAALFVSWRRAREADDLGLAATMVGRFSTVAAWSVLVVAVAGAALAWTQVRALHAATSTPYGWTLIAKVGIVVAVLLIALYNNRVLVPAVVDGEADWKASWHRLGAMVRWEIAGIVAIVAVTAFLVNVQPAAEAAGVIAPYSTFVPIGDHEVNVVVDPNRAGDNEIHLYFLSPAGSPLDVAAGVVLEFALPAEDIGPIVRIPQYAGSGHYYLAGSELALSGTWEITIRQRQSEFREEVAVVPVVVNR